MDPTTLYSLGIALIFAGLVAIFAAFLSLIFSQAKTKGKPKGAGVIIIGPLPIIFGTDKKSITIALALSLALLTMTIILYLLQK